ncbi:transposase [Methanobrevibacter olleyae]|uniref:Transposase n=1 Tax=Methanobrevibacter olleyae TaxID=294671 RepID=A0A126QYI5_METOL|nr:transposase [Methanobrevibacter olleyae]
MREIHKYTPKSVEKNRLFKCIFRSTDSITRILLKNIHTKIIRKLKS